MRYGRDLQEVGMRWLPRKDHPMLDSILGRAAAVALVAAFSACVAILVLELGRVLWTLTQ